MTVTTKSSLLQGRSCKISRSTMKSRLASITWWSGHPSRKGCSIVSLTPSLMCQKHTAKVNIYQHFNFFFISNFRCLIQFYTKAQNYLIHLHFWQKSLIGSSLQYSYSFFKRKLPKTLYLLFGNFRTELYQGVVHTINPLPSKENVITPPLASLQKSKFSNTLNSS